VGKRGKERERGRERERERANCTRGVYFKSPFEVASASLGKKVKESCSQIAAKLPRGILSTYVCRGNYCDFFSEIGEAFYAVPVAYCRKSRSFLSAGVANFFSPLALFFLYFFSAFSSHFLRFFSAFLRFSSARRKLCSFRREPPLTMIRFFG
jgi:hypothetical protein